MSKIYDIAEKLMAIDTFIWDKYGWTHGGAVKQGIYLKEIKARITKKIPKAVYEELENENYHTLNSALTKLKLFKK